MSHHVLHVFQHGAILGRERGFITCRADGQDERRLPLDDIRAVIIAAHGVTLTSSFLSGLLETDAITLHCDERYQPCGWTAPLGRVVDLKTFQKQTARPKKLNERLWHEMLRGKTLNQSRVLQHKKLRSPHLELASGGKEHFPKPRKRKVFYSTARASRGEGTFSPYCRKSAFIWEICG